MSTNHNEEHSSGHVSAAKAGNNNLMGIFAYLWILILIPFLTESKNDPFVKYHLKQGLALIIFEDTQVGAFRGKGLRDGQRIRVAYAKQDHQTGADFAGNAPFDSDASAANALQNSSHCYSSGSSVPDAQPGTFAGSAPPDSQTPIPTPIQGRCEIRHYIGGRQRWR